MVRRDRLKFWLVQVFQIGIRIAYQGALQDDCLPSRLQINQARASIAPPPLSALYPDDRRNQASDDPSGKARRSEKRLGELGHSRLRDDFDGAPQRGEGIGRHKNRSALIYSNVPYNTWPCKIFRTTTIPGQISDP